MITEKEIAAVWPEYRCEEEIGSGAYGKVFLVSGPEEGEKTYYALKCITIGSWRMPDFGKSFGQAEYEKEYETFVNGSLREVEIMMKLCLAPNIVRICEYRLKRRPKEGELDLYILMEYLTPLNDYLLYHDADEELVLKMGADLCLGLEACEKAGVLHRDIKPENIFVTEEGTFRLGDFGMAGLVSGTENAYIRLGTYEYAAPEAFNGEECSHLSDQYSLGIVLYRLLNDNQIPLLKGSSHLLNMEDREKAVMARLRGEKLPPPSSASAAAAGVILKACSLRPEDRFSSPAAFRRALGDPVSFSGKELLRKRAAAAAGACLCAAGAAVLICAVLFLKDLFSLELLSSPGKQEDYVSGIFETLDPEEVRNMKRKDRSPVFLHDPVLEKVFREETAAPENGPVTREALENMAELYLEGLAVSDFQDLSMCTGLRAINLEDTGFSDTGLLASMSGLQDAYLEGCPVETIEGLEGLEQLDCLDLSGSRLSDRGTRGRRLAGKIRFLFISDTGISDLGFISDPSSLAVLDAGNTLIGDLSVLEGCSQLRELNLEGTRVSDITALPDTAPLLETLDLGNTGVMDLKPLSEMYSLKSLTLSGTGITDISPISGLSFLETLALGENVSDDLCRHDLPRGLRYLKVSSPKVRDLSFLSDLEDLDTLDLSGTSAEDISLLSGLQGIYDLNLSGTEVKDIGPVRDMKNLHRLDLSWTDVKDLSPIEDSGIYALDLSGTEALDYSVLQRMPELSMVIAENVPEKCREVLRTLDADVYLSREEYRKQMEIYGE